MYTEEDLSFAYKFPFSKVARDIIDAQPKQADLGSDRFLSLGRARIEEAILKPAIAYKNIKYGKLDYLGGYAFARLLVSAMGNRLAIDRYVAGEAARSREALEGSDLDSVMRLAKEMRVALEADGAGFRLRLPLFLKLSPRRPDFSLTNFRLHQGWVLLDSHAATDLLAVAMETEKPRGLPIKAADIPKWVAAYAKEIPAPKIEIRRPARTGGSSWVDRLLGTPIPDVRHRVVNLILAPYLINVKGMDEKEAFSVISEYISRCKALDPNTRINDTYIMYQCRYAKRRGLRPLSLARAKELLGGFVDFEAQKGVA